VKVAPLKAGEYRFDHQANVLEVYDRIARGDIVHHTVVVPEGFNIFDVAAAVETAGLGSRDDFLEAAHETALIADLDPQAPSLEGYLFPDTYEFTRTQSMHDIVATMVHRFRKQAGAIGLNSDFHRIVTMASVIEKETAVPAERPLVASVFYNRMERRIPLATDPSVIYAALLAGRYNGVIHVSDLQYDSPYNTYKHTGLPPGPIANPGTAALQAAMHPAETDYLYFVSDNQGHHRFARTIQEHNRNVEAYRHAVAQHR
jgi:peptidoglycan lytic transglycosylase G